MTNKKKNKKKTPKTTQTAPTPSESTPIFVKRIVTDGHYSYTKYSMESEDWCKMTKIIDSLMQGKEDVRSKKIPSKFKF